MNEDSERPDMKVSTREYRRHWYRNSENAREYANAYNARPDVKTRSRRAPQPCGEIKSSLGKVARARGPVGG